MSIELIDVSMTYGTAVQIAERCGLNCATVHRAFSESRFPTFNIFGTTVARLADAEAYFRSTKRGPRPKNQR
jgi:DNA-binding phage protein